MNPLLLSALLSFAPGLLSKFFGGDPQAKYRQEVARLTAPGNVANLTNQFYHQGLASPAFTQAQGQIAQGANQAANNVAASLAARGIGTTGTGAVLSSLTPSLVGSQQAGLRTGIYQGAQGQAQNSIQAMLDALRGTQGPSQTQQYLSGGLDAFGQFLQQYLAGRGAGGGGGGGQMPWQSIWNAGNYTPPLPARR